MDALKQLEQWLGRGLYRSAVVMPANYAGEPRILCRLTEIIGKAKTLEANCYEATLAAAVAGAIAEIEARRTDAKG